MGSQNINHILTIDVNKFISLTTKSFIKFHESKSIQDHPSIFIEGKPGVGKSQSIKRIQEALAYETGKNVHLVDIRLLLFNPVDLRGIPVVNERKDAAIWLKPYIFKLNDDENTINLLFLDELTAAPLSIQAAAYQLVLDRKIGEHKLPENTFVIAAGNGINDQAISHPMPSALKNRFIHYRIVEDYQSFKTWADGKIHPFILDFLDTYPHEFVSKHLDTDSNIIITPRSWEILSKLLNYADSDDYEWVIASVVGKRIAKLMLSSESSNIQSILDGSIHEIPEDIAQIHILCEDLDKIVPKIIHDDKATNHLIGFLNQIPLDYAIPVFRTLLQTSTEAYEVEQLENYQLFIEKLESLNQEHA